MLFFLKNFYNGGEFTQKLHNKKNCDKYCFTFGQENWFFWWKLANAGSNKKKTFNINFDKI